MRLAAICFNVPESFTSELVFETCSHDHMSSATSSSRSSASSLSSSSSTSPAPSGIGYPFAPPLPSSKNLQSSHSLLSGSLSGEVVVMLARHSFLQHLESKTHKPTLFCTSGPSN
nr:hypothetical protein CFP56_27886 [Quercus suber]